jgi:hypothetical protein
MRKPSQGNANSRNDRPEERANLVSQVEIEPETQDRVFGKKNRKDGCGPGERPTKVAPDDMIDVVAEAQDDYNANQHGQFVVGHLDLPITGPMTELMAAAGVHCLFARVCS